MGPFFPAEIKDTRICVSGVSFPGRENQAGSPPPLAVFPVERKDTRICVSGVSFPAPGENETEEQTAPPLQVYRTKSFRTRESRKLRTARRQHSCSSPRALTSAGWGTGCRWKNSASPRDGAGKSPS